jgi:hypothetical protein
VTDYIVTEDGKIITTEDGREIILEGEMLTIRMRVMVAMAARLVMILTTGGYHTDIGSHVFVWRDTEQKPLGLTEVPGIVYQDLVDTYEPYTFGVDLHALKIDIRIAVLGTALEIIIRQAVADLEKAVHIDRTWGGIAIDSFLENNEMTIEHLENKVGMIQVPLMVWYTTVSGDAYMLA